jgi:hypothetical protein
MTIAMYYSYVPYVLAVWDGDMPADNERAAEEYERLVDLTEDREIPPTPKIRRYVDALLGHWPDITEEGDENSPWIDGPLMNDANGPLFVFGLANHLGEEPFTYCRELAREHGLICFDPDSEELLR